MGQSICQSLCSFHPLQPHPYLHPFPHYTYTLKKTCLDWWQNWHQKSLTLKLKHPQPRCHRPGQARQQRRPQERTGLGWRGGAGLSYTFLPASVWAGSPGNENICSLVSLQPKWVDVTYTHTPGTTWVLITVWIVRESQHIPLRCLQKPFILVPHCGDGTGGKPGCWWLTESSSFRGTLEKALPFPMCIRWVVKAVS